MAAISLASGTGETSIVTTAAGEHFYAYEVLIVPDAPGAFALWSGAVASGTRLTGNIDALAGAEYRFYGLKSVAVGDDLVLNRVDSIAVAGYVTSRLK